MRLIYRARGRRASYLRMLCGAILLEVTGANIASAESPPLTVETQLVDVEIKLVKSFPIYGKVTPRQTDTIPAGGDIYVKAQVANATDHEVKFGMMGCSQWDSWEADSSLVLVLATWGCRRNVLYIRSLKPHETFEFIIALRIAETAPIGTMTFRIGLRTPLDFQWEHRLWPDPIWSNELTLKVLPLQGHKSQCGEYPMPVECFKGATIKIIK